MCAPGFRLRLRDRELHLGERTLVMGILNVTPDSFSGDGRFPDVPAAIERGRAIEAEGADIVDIGAESTRPGSQRVSASEELERLLPVLEGLRSRISVPISVDTYKPQVAARAIAAGAEIINFPALTPILEMAEVVRDGGGALVAMHARGQPESMHQLPALGDVVGEVLAGLRALRDAALAAGVCPESLVLDPGFGFGKNGDENYALLAGLARLHELGCPLLAGTSRKAFIGRTLGQPASAGQQRPLGAHPRAWGTAAAVAFAAIAGAHIVRVHDVAEMSQVVRVADRIREFSRQ